MIVMRLAHSVSSAISQQCRQQQAGEDAGSSSQRRKSTGHRQADQQLLLAASPTGTLKHQCTDTGTCQASCVRYAICRETRCAVSNRWTVLTSPNQCRSVRVCVPQQQLTRRAGRFVPELELRQTGHSVTEGKIIQGD